MCHPEAVAYHHHYTALEVQRMQAFAVFQNAYQGLPNVFTNSLVYPCPSGEHVKNIDEANRLIKGLRLPLKALPAAFGAENTFIVQFLEEGQPG